MDAEAPTAAPDEMPMTPGSASGLRNTPCMTTPAVASAAPTSTAMSSRGTRMSHSVASPLTCAIAAPGGTARASRPTARTASFQPRANAPSTWSGGIES